MKPKLNLAIYSEGFFTGGTERQMIELIKGLDRDRYQVYPLSSRIGGLMAQDLINADIPINHFPLTSLRNVNALRQLFRLRRFLITKKIDILHTFSVLGNTFGVMAGLLARTPIII